MAQFDAAAKGTCPKVKAPGLLMIAAPILLTHGTAAFSADCFDRTLAIARYHFVNPGNVADNWQEIYEISLSSGMVQSATRLTKGAITLPRYDSSSPVYTQDGSKIVFVESDAGGANARLKVMDAVDSDGNLEGDNASVLDATDVDIASVARGTNDLLIYGKFDAAGDTQIASASLTGNTLGAVSLHTDDADYPDGFSFVADMEVIYDADGQSLKHINLGSGTITTLTGPNPRDRQPSGRIAGDTIFFSRIVSGTIDLWQAKLNAGPALSDLSSFVTTTAFNEVSASLSDDGACLAYLASDLSIGYGPNSDLWIRDLSTGQTQQITQTRDLAAITWKP